MSEFTDDMLKEVKGGKYSTKKVWGHICMLLSIITYVVDGFNFYKVNDHLFDSLLIAGTTLLGLGVIFTRKGNKTNETE